MGMVRDPTGSRKRTRKRINCKYLGELSPLIVLMSNPDNGILHTEKGAIVRAILASQPTWTMTVRRNLYLHSPTDSDRKERKAANCKPFHEVV